MTISVQKKMVQAVVVTTPVILYTLPILMSLSGLAGHDWDYFFAYYEALRKSIVEYHQFPWWNPWVAGGTPLFANPQIGLFSLQTPLVLALGTVLGLKVAAIVYIIIGFWGCLLLLRQFSFSESKSVLLSYIFVMNGFTAWHFYAGHYTFLIYLLFPLSLYLFVRKRSSRLWAVYFGVSVALIINSALHNLTIQFIYLLCGAGLVELIKSKKKKETIITDLISLAVAIPLCLPRLLFTYQYVSNFPRDLSGNLSHLTFSVAMRALMSPFQRVTDGTDNYFNWWEVGSYISLFVVAAFGIVFVSATLLYKKNGSEDSRPVTMGLIAVAAFVIALGSFAGSYSPYNLLFKVPAFSMMQCSGRWFAWCILFIILAIASFHRFGKLINALLICGVISVFFVNQQLLDVFQYEARLETTKHSFAQYNDYPKYAKGYSSMYLATSNNFGEIKGYEPMLGYDSSRPTERCGINMGCSMISANAEIISWTPNQLIIGRKGGGPIFVNMNPSNYWLIDGERVFADLRAAEPEKNFEIDSLQSKIVLTIKPPLPRLGL